MYENAQIMLLRSLKSDIKWREEQDKQNRLANQRLTYIIHGLLITECVDDIGQNTTEHQNVTEWQTDIQTDAQKWSS